jgi:hypothetical protein
MVCTNFAASTDRNVRIEATGNQLAGVAVRIQLPLALYNLTADRYETIPKWIERESSPLTGRVIRLFAQGSKADNATIAARAENDERSTDSGRIEGVSVRDRSGAGR